MNTLIINNVNVEVRLVDNFVNATQLCNVGGKRFTDWMRRKKSQRAINDIKDIIREENNLPNGMEVNIIDTTIINQRIIYWLHPHLVSFLAKWISASIYIPVSRWYMTWFARKDKYDNFKKELLDAVLIRQIRRNGL